MPHQTIDPIPIAAALVSTIQTIVSRGMDPIESAVISVGKVQAGSASNVIAEVFHMEGTVRTFKKVHQDFIIQRLQEVCEGIGIAYRAKISLDYRVGYPSTINS